MVEALAAAVGVGVVLFLMVPLGLAALRLGCAREADRDGVPTALVDGFGIGLALASLVAMALGLVGAPLVAATAALLGLAAASTALLMRRGAAGPEARGWVPREARGSVVLAAVGVGLAGLAAWQGPWLSHTADGFYHLAAVRSALLKGEAFPTLPMYAERGPTPDPTSSGWHTVLAVAASLVGLDPLDLWVAVHPLAAALPALALAGLAWRLSGSLAVALAAVGVQFLAYQGLDLREAGYPNQVGLAVFWAWLSLLIGALPAGSEPGPVPAAFRLSAPRQGRGRRRGRPPGGRDREGPGLGSGRASPRLAPPLRRVGLLAAALAGAAAVHLGLASALLAIGAIGALWLLVGRRLTAARRLSIALLVGAAVAALRSLPLAALSPALDDRVGLPAYPAASPSVSGPVLGPLTALLTAPALGPPAPTLVATLVAVGILLAPRLRWRPLGPLAAGGLLPLATALLVQLPVSPAAGYWLIRTAMPLGGLQAILLASALVLPLGRWRPADSARGTPRRRVLALVACAAVGWSTLAAGVEAVVPRLGPAEPGSHSFASSRASDLRLAWADRLDALRRLPPGTVLSASPDVAYHLAGLLPLFVTATPLSHTPVVVERAGGWLRRGDVLDALDRAAEPARAARLLAASRASFMLVDSSSPTWPTWRDRPPPPIGRVDGGATWALLAVDRARLADAVPSAPGAAWTIVPADPVAGDLALVRLATPPTGPAEIVLRAGGRDLAGGAIDAGSSTAALPIPSDTPVGRHRLVARSSGVETPLGEVAVGREYEAESFPLRLASAPGAGWSLYQQSFYGRQLAARSNGPASVARPIQPLAPGRYALLVRVYEYPGSRLNEVAVRLGGAQVGFLWGGEADAPRWVSNQVETSAVATALELSAPRVEQIYAVVDTIRIYPAP
jgi:hypothetical protein